MRIATAFALVSLVLAMPLQATTMLVHMSDGTVDTIEVSSVDRMQFASEPMAARPGAGAVRSRIAATTVRVAPDGIAVHMATSGTLEMQVTDIRGRIVGKLPRRAVSAGMHRFETAVGSTPGAGMYIVRVWANGTLYTTRTLTLR